MPVYDYIVVGSGCSGAIAAQTLVEAGAKVTMLDVGVKKDSDSKIPNEDFVTLRKTDPQQYRYFIGDHAEGVNWGKIGTGAQITPPRKYIIRLADRYIPSQSSTFSSFESLGYGGMGIGWSLQSWEYNKTDLEAAGMDYAKMSRAYNTVVKRIGVSASENDATKGVINNFDNYQPAPKMDRNNSRLYNKYLARKNKLNKRGITVGQTPLALITKNLGDRKKYAYKGMDFYSDNDKSGWRPWITVDQLKKKSNFNYIDGHLVVRFVEKKDVTEVHCLQIGTDKPVVFQCRKLILGTGALGSARIVLRSFKDKDAKLPILCSAYTYIPCVQPSMVGKETESKKLGLAQLSIFLDKERLGEKASMASLHSYQSLMLFRLMPQVPFNLVDSRILMRYLSTGIVTMGVYHPDGPSPNKYLWLTPDSKSPTGDKLKINYSLLPEEEKEYDRREKKLMKAIRKMGAYPIKRINPGYGIGIHYGGTLPFSKQEKPFTLSPSGRLHGTKNVYVADSSGFNYLPAQGLTLSIMANAHLVAEEASHGSN
jgi:hypothetical protein